MAAVRTSKPQIAVVFKKLGEIRLYTATSTGSLRISAKVQVGRGVRAVEAGDFNGDGRQALAAISSSRRLLLLEASDARWRSAHEIPLSDIPTRLAVGRFLSPKRDAVAILQGTSPKTQSIVYWQYGRSGWTKGPTFKAEGAKAIERLRAPSGREALIVLRSGKWSVHRGVERSFKGECCPDAYSVAGSRVRSKVNLAIACHRGALEVIEDASSPQLKRHPTGRGAYDVHAADLDGDGQLDFGTADLRAATMTLHYSSAGHTTYKTSPGPGALLDVDLDGDGDLDVVLMAIEGHRLEIFKNTRGDR